MKKWKYDFMFDLIKLITVRDETILNLEDSGDQAIWTINLRNNSDSDMKVDQIDNEIVEISCNLHFSVKNDHKATAEIHLIDSTKPTYSAIINIISDNCLQELLAHIDSDNNTRNTRNRARSPYEETPVRSYF